MILHATFNLRSEHSLWPVKGRNQTGLFHSNIPSHVEAEKMITCSVRVIRVSYLILVYEEKHDGDNFQEKDKQEKDEELWRNERKTLWDIILAICEKHLLGITNMYQSRKVRTIRANRTEWLGDLQLSSTHFWICKRSHILFSTSPHQPCLTLVARLSCLMGHTSSCRLIWVFKTVTSSSINSCALAQLWFSQIQDDSPSTEEENISRDNSTVFPRGH